MEIKVACGCGTNYKFDVEPVNRRMPWPVNCPSCGADGTAQANEIIQQASGASQSAVPQMAVPMASVSPAPPAGLRISTPTRPTAPAIPAMPSGVPAPPPPSAPPPLRPSQVFAQEAQMAPEKQSSTWARLGIILLTLLVAASIGYRVARRIGRLANVVSAIANAAVSGPDGEDRKWNLTADNQVIIYLRHTNHQEVADACAAYFHQQLHRNVRRKTPDQDNNEGQEFLVMSPFHDYVEFLAELGSLKEPEFAGLAQHLSGKFNTLAFVEQDVDASGAAIFGVYEQGTNQFYAHMDVTMQNGEPVENVTTQGDDWAVAHGYKPGTNGFKEFNIENADDLTKNCGMKFWDHDEEITTNDVVLKEWGGQR